MSHFAKTLLIIAGILILVGALVFVLVMSIYGWDFTKLSTEKYGLKVHNVSEDFDRILIYTDTADITFKPSPDGSAQVLCHEKESDAHSVSVDDYGTLIIKKQEDKKWHFGINFQRTKITVFLPESEYSSLCVIESTGDINIPKDFKFNSINIEASTGDISVFASVKEHIKINTSTGDITVKDVKAGSLELSASTGDITVTGVEIEGAIRTRVSTGKTHFSTLECELLTSSGSTGDIILSHLTVRKIINIERSTGDVSLSWSDAEEIYVKTDTGYVSLSWSDAEEIYVKTDTGDVIGSLLSEKVFITKTDTGMVNVPNTITGGRCEISTDTGNIYFVIIENPN